MLEWMLRINLRYSNLKNYAYVYPNRREGLLILIMEKRFENKR